MKRYGFIICLVLFAGIANAQPDSLHLIWDKRGYGEQSHFGAQIYALGDQNNDGNADFAVLSAGTGTPGQESEPRFDLFHGGNPPDTIPYMTFRGRLSPSRDFLEAMVIGDVNGDGYKDWWTWNYVPGDTVAQVDVFFGGPSADTIADALFHFPATSSDWMDPIGDLNGDGFDDFYMYRGSDGHDETYFYFGGSPLDSLPAFVIHSNPFGSQNSLPRTFGDLNGDGYGDFVTATNYVHPTTYIYLGGNLPDTLADYVWPDFRVDRVFIAPSLNGDQSADLAVGRSLRMDVHFGGGTISPVPDFTLTFPGCDLGPTEIDYGGDFNDDGYGDLTAISDCDLGLGAFRLYLGHPWLNAGPVLSVDGAEPPLNLIGIIHARTVGDVNGDGVQDLGICATNQMTIGQARRGRVVILAGDTAYHANAGSPQVLLPGDLNVAVYPNPLNAATTIALEVPFGVNKIELLTYNLLGQQVKRQEIPAMVGAVRYNYDASDLATGMYLLRVTAGRFSSTQKMVVLK